MVCSTDKAPPSKSFLVKVRAKNIVFAILVAAVVAAVAAVTAVGAVAANDQFGHCQWSQSNFYCCGD